MRSCGDLLTAPVAGMKKRRRVKLLEVRTTGAARRALADPADQHVLLHLGV